MRGEDHPGPALGQRWPQGARPPRVVVVFATHNGGDTLARMLAAMERVTAPEGGYAIVAVDNAGAAASATTLADAARRLPLVSLAEPRKGKNRALNHALDWIGPDLAAIDLVVFTDDDVLPDADWLLALLACAEAHPGADLFGGAIVPHFDAAQPAWLSDFADEMPVLYAQTSCQEGPCAAEMVFGPNMAVRGRVLAGGVRFNEDFGPNGGPIFPMGSETELCERLAIAGHAAAFAARARVGHIVNAGQLDEDWVISRASRHGLGVAMRAVLRRGGRTPPWVIALIARLGAAALVRYALARLTGSAAARRRARYQWNWVRGLAMGLARR